MDQNGSQSGDEIKDRYLESLQARNGRTEFKYSPEYLATRPANSLEALHITPEQQEEVLYHFAVTSSIPKTVLATGVDTQRVRAIIFNPDSSKIVKSIRDKVRISVIDRIGETQAVLLDAIQDPHKLANASLRELSNVFSEITASQVSLTTAQREAEGPSFGAVDPSEIFSGDELEYMAFLRRRLDAGPRPSTLPQVDGEDFAGHEFIDPGYEPVPTPSAPSPEELAEDESS